MRRTSPARHDQRQGTDDVQHEEEDLTPRDRSPIHSSRGSSRASSSSSTPPPRPTQRALNLCYKQKYILHGHTKGVSQVRYSPDGLWIASASADGTIRIWDAGDGRHMRTLEGHLGGVSTIAWSPDSKTIASGSDDKAIRLWDRVTGKPLPVPLLGHHNYVYSLAFSPKGNILASGSFDEAVFLWDLRARKQMRSLPAHSDPVGGVDFVKDGTLVCSCSTDGLIRLWDTQTGQCLRTIVHEDNPPVTTLRFSPNGRYILACTLDHCVRLWDYVSGTCKKTYQGHVNGKYSLDAAFGRDDAGQAFIVAGSEDGDLLFWDVQTKAVVQRVHGHRGCALWVDCAPGPHSNVVSAGLDGTVRIWVNVNAVERKLNGGGGDRPDAAPDIAPRHEGADPQADTVTHVAMDTDDVMVDVKLEHVDEDDEGDHEEGRDGREARDGLDDALLTNGHEREREDEHEHEHKQEHLTARDEDEAMQHAIRDLDRMEEG